MFQTDPFALIVLFVGMSLLPFVAMIATSYLNIVIVMSLIRNALGIQSIPPNMVINALAMILTFYIMAPVFSESWDIAKAEMARRIFSDADLLRKVNELVHPAVNRYIHEEIERERKEGRREFFVLESALLVENGYDRIVDSMWYIYCDEQVRRERLKSSRGYSDEKISAIIGRQVSEEVYRRTCDVVIDNTGPLTAEEGAIAQVDAAIAGLRERFHEI